MVTNQHPIDYRKKVILVSQLARVCGICGEYAYIHPRTNAWTCMTCDSTGTDIIEKYEHELPAFRAEREAALDAFFAATEHLGYNA